jgi:hypothetical protein
MRAIWFGLLVMVLLSVSSVGVAAAGNTTADPPAIHQFLTVMTYNLYQGTELGDVLAAKSTVAFVLGVATDYGHALKNNFSARATAIATEVATARPVVIGLQEVALWRTQFPSNTASPATNVAYDSLQVLLSALAAQGLNYTPVVVRSNWDAQAPGLFPFGFMDVRLTDRSAILVNASLLAPNRLVVSNPQNQTYTNYTVFPTLVGKIPLLGSWESVDLTVGAHTVRFISTHMDGYSAKIRLAQAKQLLAGPMNTTLPVIFSGDLNTNDSGVSYAAFIAAGFNDSWPAIHPGVAGYTCCQTLPDVINNSNSTLSQRIDFVLTLGSSLSAKNAFLVGDVATSRTSGGLWPSDHAGLVVEVATS